MRSTSSNADVFIRRLARMRPGEKISIGYGVVEKTGEVVSIVWGVGARAQHLSEDEAVKAADLLEERIASERDSVKVQSMATAILWLRHSAATLQTMKDMAQ